MVFVKLIIVALYIFSIGYVHLRGRVRHKFGRQLSDHSSFLAPINCLLYLCSKLPNRPFLSPAQFPDLSPLQAHWQEIRAEGLGLLHAGRSNVPSNTTMWVSTRSSRPVGSVST